MEFMDISSLDKFMDEYSDIFSQNKRKIIATSRVFAADLSTQQNQVYKVVEEYSNIFSSPTWVLLHC
jgi:hypothetical protein